VSAWGHSISLTFLKSTRYLLRTGRYYAWPTLLKKDGDELFDHYRHTLEDLGNE
jgi:hypothetical protein